MTSSQCTAAFINPCSICHQALRKNASPGENAPKRINELIREKTSELILIKRMAGDQGTPLAHKDSHPIGECVDQSCQAASPSRRLEEKPTTHCSLHTGNSMVSQSPSVTRTFNKVGAL